MKKPHLLPHFCIWIGLALLIASAAVSALYLFPSLRWTFNSVWNTAYRGILPLSLVIICFSKEKVEDELITETRHKSLLAPVIIYFALVILEPWASNMVKTMAHTYNTYVHYLNIANSFVLLPAASYLIVFRANLWKQKKAIGHEE